MHIHSFQRGKHMHAILPTVHRSRCGLLAAVNQSFLAPVLTPQQPMTSLYTPHLLILTSLEGAEP